MEDNSDLLTFGRLAHLPRALILPWCLAEAVLASACSFMTSSLTKAAGWVRQGDASIPENETHLGPAANMQALLAGAAVSIAEAACKALEACQDGFTDAQPWPQHLMTGQDRARKLIPLVLHAGSCLSFLSNHADVDEHHAYASAPQSAAVTKAEEGQASQVPVHHPPAAETVSAPPASATLQPGAESQPPMHVSDEAASASEPAQASIDVNEQPGGASRSEASISRPDGAASRSCPQSTAAPASVSEHSDGKELDSAPVEDAAGHDSDFGSDWEGDLQTSSQPQAAPPARAPSDKDDGIASAQHACLQAGTYLLVVISGNISLQS